MSSGTGPTGRRPSILENTLPVAALEVGSVAEDVAVPNSVADAVRATNSFELAPTKSSAPASDSDATEKSETVHIEEDDGLSGKIEDASKSGPANGTKSDAVDAAEAGQPRELRPWEKGTYWERFKGSMTPMPGLTMVNAKPEDHPDGYYGWVVLAACFFVFLFGLGLMYSTGVYLRFFFYNGVFPGVTLFQLSWIGSLGMATQTMIGPITGRLTERIGQKVMAFIGGGFIAIAYITASFVTEWWQLLLTQGFCYGLGAGFLYFAMVTLPSQWFFKYRGLAIGIAVAGAGLGGLVIGPMSQALIDAYGWRWALRITGFIAGGVICVSALFIRIRFDLVKQQVKPFDLSFFKDYKFVALYCSFFIQQFGMFVVFNYLPSYATNAGLSASQGALALGLSNAASAIGRIVIGAFADKTGHVNGYSVCMMAAPIFTLVIWPFATSMGVLCLFGILFGFFSGGYISLFPTVIIALFGPANLGARMGSMFTATLPGNLAGSPLAGLIVGSTAQTMPDGTTHFNYTSAIMYSGFTQLAAGIIVTVLRFKVVDWKFWKRI